MSNKKTVAVWFSCGAASAVAAKLTLEKYGESHNILIVNNPVDEEHEDNQRFLKDVSLWLGHPIIKATNPKLDHTSAMKVWEKSKYMSGINGAPCTLKLKKEARYAFESQHKIDYHVLGFTVDEWKRAKKFKESERDNLIPILVQEMVTKEDCFTILLDAGIKLPAIYGLGFPNANCIGCVKATSPTYWNLVREKFPEVFQKMSVKSRELGCKLVRVKGERIYLDELSPDAKGGKMKSVECGIFCDTN